MNIDTYNSIGAENYADRMNSCLKCNRQATEDLCDHCRDVKMETIGLEKILEVCKRKETDPDYEDISLPEAIMEDILLQSDIEDLFKTEEFVCYIIDEVENEGYIELSAVESEIIVTEKGNKILNPK